LLAQTALSKFGKIDVVQLFFHRLITQELFSFFPVVNIHPALLPAFKGLNPISQMLDAKVKFLGATMHQVDESLDGGQIIGQAIMPINSSHTKQMLMKFSFVQKTFLFLLLVDLLESKILQFEQGQVAWKMSLLKNLPYTDRCNPIIQNPEYLEGILNLQKREGVEVIKI
jgi:folate-dependent phosphoribosylglycinamide formyltransferase PurN